MSTSLPILRKILTAPRDWEGDEETVGLLRAAKNSAFPFFDIQVASDIQQQKALNAPGRRIIIDETSGQIRSPYPEIWMEWSRGNYHVGCLLAQREKRRNNRYFDDTDCDQVLIFWFHEQGWSQIARMDFNVLVKMTDDDGFGGWGIDGEPLTDGQDDLAQTFIGIVVTALALINCKNVTTRETGQINQRRSGAQKRRGEPPHVIRYHTIILPGGGTQSDGQGGHRATALHRVRGHFKHFTTEKPLMGRHVGTYWWGWQVRGNAENGAIVSDYKLKVSR